MRPQSRFAASAGKFLHFSSVPDSQQAIRHRDALVKMGYLTTRNYAIAHINVGTSEFTRLCEVAAMQAGQKPTVQFGFSPGQTQVVSLTVWSTPEEFPIWEQFVSEFALARTRCKEGRQFLADELEKLLAMPVTTEADMTAWVTAGKQLRQTLRVRYPDVQVEGQIYNFLGRVGVETRRRDLGFRRWQENIVRTYITEVRAEK
jgi:hypothetical protein